MTPNENVNALTMMREILETGHGDMLRTVLANALADVMEAEVAEKCGAGHGQRLASRDRFRITEGPRGGSRQAGLRTPPERPPDPRLPDQPDPAARRRVVHPEHVAVDAILHVCRTVRAVEGDRRARRSPRAHLLLRAVGVGHIAGADAPAGPVADAQICPPAGSMQQCSDGSDRMPISSRSYRVKQRSTVADRNRRIRNSEKKCERKITRVPTVSSNSPKVVDIHLVRDDCFSMPPFQISGHRPIV